MNEVWILTADEWHEDVAGEYLLDVYTNKDKALKGIAQRRDNGLSRKMADIDNQIGKVKNKLESGDLAPNRATEKLDDLDRRRQELIVLYAINEGKDENGRLTIGFSGGQWGCDGERITRWVTDDE